MNKYLCKILIVICVVSIIGIFLYLGYHIKDFLKKNNIETFDTDESIFSTENAPDNQYRTYLIFLHKKDCPKGKQIYNNVWIPAKEYLNKYKYMVNDVKVTMLVLDSDDDDRSTAFKSIRYSDQIDVTEYPTFVLFHNGKLCQYKDTMNSNQLIKFLKSSVQKDEFICLSPNYYNDSQDTACLPFVSEA